MSHSLQRTFLLTAVYQSMLPDGISMHYGSEAAVRHYIGLKVSQARQSGNTHTTIHQYELEIQVLLSQDLPRSLLEEWRL